MHLEKLSSIIQQPTTFDLVRKNILDEPITEVPAELLSLKKVDVFEYVDGTELALFLLPSRGRKWIVNTTNPYVEYALFNSNIYDNDEYSVSNVLVWVNIHDKLEELNKVFETSHFVVLYFVSYGGISTIRKPNYSDSTSLRLTDVKVVNSYLNYEEVRHIAKLLNVPTLPYLESVDPNVLKDISWYEYMLTKYISRAADYKIPLKGLEIKPPVVMLDKFGNYLRGHINSNSFDVSH